MLSYLYSSFFSLILLHRCICLERRENKFWSWASMKTKVYFWYNYKRQGNPSNHLNFEWTTVQCKLCTNLYNSACPSPKMTRVKSVTKNWSTTVIYWSKFYGLQVAAIRRRLDFVQLRDLCYKFHNLHSHLMGLSSAQLWFLLL